MKALRFSLATAGILLLLVAQAAPQVPSVIPFQAVIKNADGEVIGADTAVRFEIYALAEGGTALWGPETHTVTPQNGIVSVFLGGGSPAVPINPNTVFGGGDRYLAITVAGTALTPRIRLGSTPYAFMAATVVDGAVTAAKLASNAVTTAKIADGSVTQAKLSGGVTLPPGGTAGGDLAGTYPNPTVAQIQGRSVATTAPSTGQVLKWSGSAWAPQADAGLTLPYIGSSGDPTIFRVDNTATTGTTYGVYGTTSSTAGFAMVGWAFATTGTTYGVFGRSDSSSGFGTYGFAAAATGATRGVLGRVSSADANAYGVYFTGGLAGTGTKSFQIDHPFDPANKYLNHYCTEGAEPLNVYSGNVVVDGRGEAVVDLPHYFESINRDYRYQLTPLGAAMPNLHVAERIQANRFRIAGGTPGMEVSWRVEAVRNDLYVQQRGAPVELEKPVEHRGKYLHPEFYRLPAEMGIYYHLEMRDDQRD